MKFPQFIANFAGIAALSVLFASCSDLPLPNHMNNETQYLAGFGGAPGQQDASQKGFWDGDSATGSPKIRINLSEQKAYFYKGDAIVGISPISSGSAKHRTPRGSYKVTQRSPDHRSSLYGQHVDIATGTVVNPDVDTRKDPVPPGAKYVGAPMPHFLRFNGGIGMHEGFLPGYSASHGCVRLPKKMARHFYDSAPLGTVVIVE